MADRIEHFPAEQRPPTRRYPWNEWTDGSVWRLVRGEDFDQETDQFRNRLYPQASRRGMKVRSAKRIEEVINESDATTRATQREVLFIQFFEADSTTAESDAQFASANGAGAETPAPTAAA
jgi:hypothetical protein